VGVVRIPRVAHRRSHEDPKPAWGVDAGGSLFVRCGGCGVCAGLDHEVAPDGTVAPSLVCPDCGWHVMATLEGWQGQGSA
jgi:hypothetical protein